MIKILVGSENPVKVEAVRESFLKYFKEIEIKGLKAGSGVSAQPVNEETFQGAMNRAFFLKNNLKDDGFGADYFVGIEGGITEMFGQWFALGVMCIVDKYGRSAFGTSPLFELPARVTAELLAGTELGDVMDKITGEENTKQKAGAIGFFTKGIMDRKELYVQGLVTALIPFMNRELFFNNSGSN